MNRVGPKIIICLISWSGLALVGGLVPAQAQFWGHPPPPYDLRDELSPRELGRAAIAQGFEIVSQPRYRDEYATAAARDRNGRPVRLTMDTFTGQIVNVRALAAVQPERPIARVAPLRERPERRPEPAQRPEPERRPEASTPKAPPVAAPPSPRVVAPAAPGERATPDRPTVIRREPLLPAPATPPAAAQPPAARAPAAQAPAAVGSGTRTAPRRIDIAPSTGDAPGGSTPPL